MASMQHDISPEPADDPAWAPEAGQPQGGRDDPWDLEDNSDDPAWPAPSHAAPKDEL